MLQLGQPYLEQQLVLLVIAQIRVLFIAGASVPVGRVPYAGIVEAGRRADDAGFGGKREGGKEREG